MNKKRRFLGKLIADLQNSSNTNQTSSLTQEPKLQKKRIIPPLYEFFLIGEINLELQLDTEDEYFPIGIKQSPLNKWRPFVKAQQFNNRIEMTIDASFQGISEFEFIIQKLQCCSSDTFKQLALYLYGYQHFVRRIKEKMLKNPVPTHLYEYKFQTFLKKSTEYIDNLPNDGLYAASILQLDYTIYNTKRIKFMVSKSLAEIVGGVEMSEAAQILLRKGWMEIFGGAQRIMKNIMLLNRLMKEGRQLLTFKIYTVDKILIQVQAEIEIVQCLRNFVDVGFVEIINFTISPETRSYLHQVRNSNNQLKSLPYELYFNDKTFDPLPPSTPVTYQNNYRGNQLSNQTQYSTFEDNQVKQKQNELSSKQQQQNYKSRSLSVQQESYINGTDDSVSCQQNAIRNQSYSESTQIENKIHQQIQPNKQQQQQYNDMFIKQNQIQQKEKQQCGFDESKQIPQSSNQNIIRNNNNNYNDHNIQEISSTISNQILENQEDLFQNTQQNNKFSQDIIYQDKKLDEQSIIENNRHPNYDKHILDEQYSLKSQAFMEKFYTEQEIKKIKLAQQNFKKKIPFPNFQKSDNDCQEYNVSDFRNDVSSHTNSFDLRSKTSSVSDQLQLTTGNSPQQNFIQSISKNENNYQIKPNYLSNQNLNSNDSSYKASFNNQNYSINQNKVFCLQQDQTLSDTSQFKNNQAEENTENKWINSKDIYQNDDYVNQNERLMKPYLIQQSSNPYSQCLIQQMKSQEESIIQSNQNLKEMSQLERNEYNFEVHTPTYNKPQIGSVNHINTSSNSNQDLKENQHNQNGQQTEKQEQNEDFIENFEIYGQNEYFNIFEDESLAFTVEDLNKQQRKLQKLMFQSYDNQLY